MSFTAYQIAEQGSLLDFAQQQRDKGIQRQQQQQQQQQQRKERKSPLSANFTGRLQRPFSPYKYFNNKLEILFEPPFKCCDLWDTKEYNCLAHPRHPPYEYYSDSFLTASRSLRKAYRVDLWVFHKHCEEEFRALHTERRQKLQRQHVPPEQDFPIVQPRTMKEKKKLLGKLCIFHTFSFSPKHIHRQWSQDCFICRCGQVRKRQAAEREQIYRDYCAKVYSALDKTHKEMGYNLFACDRPAFDPEIEANYEGTRSAPVIRITDWSENQKGQPGNHDSLARDKAERQEGRKVNVWARMSGESGNTKLSGYVLTPIPEED